MMSLACRPSNCTWFRLSSFYLEKMLPRCLWWLRVFSSAVMFDWDWSNEMLFGLPVDECLFAFLLWERMGLNSFFLCIEYLSKFEIVVYNVDSGYYSASCSCSCASRATFFNFNFMLAKSASTTDSLLMSAPAVDLPVGDWVCIVHPLSKLGSWYSLGDLPDPVPFRYVVDGGDRLACSLLTLLTWEAVFCPIFPWCLITKPPSPFGESGGLSLAR